VQVSVLYFAAVKAITEVDEEEIVLPEGSTVRALHTQLQHRFPALLPYERALRFAVNESFASEDRPLQDGDVVALIPPVAGG
jgi:MoaE-MoaD fusion protein